MNGKEDMQLAMDLHPPPKPAPEPESPPTEDTHHVLEMDGGYAYAIEKYDVDPDIVRAAIDKFGADYEEYLAELTGKIES